MYDGDCDGLAALFVQRAREVGSLPGANVAASLGIVNVREWVEVFKKNESSLLYREEGCMKVVSACLLGSNSCSEKERKKEKRRQEIRGKEEAAHARISLGGKNYEDDRSGEAAVQSAAT